MNRQDAVHPEDANAKIEESEQTALPEHAAARPQRVRRRFLNPTVVIGGVILAFWVLMALLTFLFPTLLPYTINDIDSGQVWKPPSAAHLMGTDDLGRDIYARLMIGSQQMVILPVVSVSLAVALGTAIGLFTGYRGGWADEIIMRGMDMMMAFPVIMLYLMIIVAVGASALNVVLAVAIATAPSVSRLARGLVLDLRSREFVAAARMRGESTTHILFREILPNITGSILVDGLVRVGYATFSIAALGFLGLGVPPPNPDWGRMTIEGRQAILIAPTAALFPALAIASLVIAYNLLADGLTEAAQVEA
jgi:peptide/nickel transport system permease protein